MEGANNLAKYYMATITTVKSFIKQIPCVRECKQGTLTEGEGSVRLTSLY
jgi:hypothetical protein